MPFLPLNQQRQSTEGELKAIVPEKWSGNKKCDQEEGRNSTTKFWPFWHLSTISVTWLFATFLILYVHSVQDSTLLSILDQFCFSFVFSGVAKNGH